MKTLIPSLLLLAPIGAFAADEANSGVGLGFEIGTSYFLPSQTPANKGLGNFFAVDLNVGSVTVGYYFESLKLKFKADDNVDGQAGRIDADVNINEVRLIKPIIKEVAIGLGVGMADVKAVSAIEDGADDAATPSFDSLAPTAEIFARITPLSGGDKVKAAVNVTLGYRFIAIDSTVPAGTADFTDTIDNLNGFRIGLSVGIAF